jgi:hypothetical protein
VRVFFVGGGYCKHVCRTWSGGYCLPEPVSAQSNCCLCVVRGVATARLCPYVLVCCAWSGGVAIARLYLPVRREVASGCAYACAWSDG